MTNLVTAMMGLGQEWGQGDNFAMLLQSRPKKMIQIRVVILIS